MMQEARTATEQTRTRLLDAAREAFSQHGFQSRISMAGIRHISEKAGKKLLVLPRKCYYLLNQNSSLDEPTMWN